MVLSKRDAVGMLWRVGDIIMDADHADSQPAGEREENTAEMHMRLAVEIPLQDIEIIMWSGDCVCGDWTRGSAAFGWNTNNLATNSYQALDITNHECISSAWIKSSDFIE